MWTCHDGAYLILHHETIYAFPLKVLVVEVLHGLMVEQGVHDCTAGLVVHLVHVSSDLDPPLRDGNGIRRVGCECARRERAKLPAKAVAKDTSNQRYLQRGGYHVEHDGVQHETDATASAIQDT
eukprot:scaffold1068_cov375-Prasinococcus_capsulatus_cf.AAC.22